MPPQVIQAFCDAASEWVPLEQLQAAASRKIAEATATEAGLVTGGAAAALTLGTAAILAGEDLGRIERLPHCDGFPNEMIIAREQRCGYDHAILAAGARFVEVGFNEIVSNAGVRRTELWEYEAAIGPNTAGIAYRHAADSQPDLKSLVELAHSRGLPVIVDAAGELPPRDNLKAIPATGADLVAFSGGKAIRGPQSTGILCGSRKLISSAALQMLDMDDHLELWDPPAELIDRTRLNGIPRHGLGRGFKVGKEEIAALLVALDLFASGAYDEDLPRLRSQLDTIVETLKNARCECAIKEPASADRWALLEITVDEAAIGRDAFEVCRRLRGGSPPIYVGHGQLAEGVLVVNPLCLDEVQTGQLASRLRDELA
jgi:L-seryl-tRNA(Ser) seleniumtransferase